tara:strand:+ start:7282 stop:7650 length:369 start_codon:yes stop_codon:yes gene_type:complete
MTNPKNVGRVEDYNPNDKEDLKELTKLFDAAQAENSNVKYQLVVENKTCYLKKLDRETLEVALGYLMPTRGNPKPITSGERIINTCWVSGDTEIRSDEDLFVTACLQAAEIIDNKSSFLKKR